MSRPRCPRRFGECTEATAVTFIVTLAAMQTVTLAARRAGMSRKSVYALKSRDPAFAAAWAAAVTAGSRVRSKGDKVSEVSDPRFSSAQGDTRLANFDAELRDHFFSRLAANRRDSVAGSRAQLR
jgi:hypothetical protein